MRHARSTDPETSHEAARAVHVTEQEAMVIGLLARGPMTSYTMADLLGKNVVCVSPALRPLVRKGLVKDSGDREWGSSGRRRILWELT